MISTPAIFAGWVRNGVRKASQAGRLCAISLFLMAWAGCGGKKEAATPPTEIARVGTNSISQDTFQTLLNLRGPVILNNSNALSAKEAVLDELIRREAIFVKAKAAGFDQRPEIQEAIKRLVTSKFQDEQMKLQDKAEFEVSDATVQQYYQQHADKYTAPAKIRGAILFLKISPFATQEKKRALAAKAQELLGQAKAGTPEVFARLVGENSDDRSTRYRAGDLGWINPQARMPEADPAVLAALETLQTPGEFAPLVSGKAGFYLVKLLEAQPSATRPLKEVKEAIIYAVRRDREEKRELNFFTTMKAGLDIRTNQALFESIVPPSQSFAVPVTPGAVAQK